MFYPLTVGNWSRQVQQNQSQWVYKPVNRNWAQTLFDHITIQLVRDGETSDCDGDFHYTTTGSSNFKIILDGQERLGNSLVYSYDYKIDLATGSVKRSSQGNHNADRYPKKYVNDTRAAKFSLSAPQIKSDQLLNKDYAAVFDMRDVESSVTGFWRAFPRTKISIFGSFPTDSKAFEFSFKVGNDDAGTVKTDSATGKAVFWGGPPNQDVFFKCSTFGKDWTKIRTDTSFMDPSGRFSVGFS